MPRSACLILALLFSACSSEPPPQAPPAASEKLPSIVALGDSLTAGFGVRPEQSYPARLEQRLQAAGKRYRVINAGISGETSSGTLARLDWVLQTVQPEALILITGGNDGLRGQSTQLLRDNLEDILSKLRAKQIPVVLGGMRMLPNLGPDYTRAFEAVYPAIAVEQPVIFVPFVLEGIAGDRSLMQNDGIHPNSEGHERMAELLYPYVLQALQL